MLNPPLPPSIIGEAMPRGAAGSFTPRVVLSRPSGGGGGAITLATFAGRTFNETNTPATGVTMSAVRTTPPPTTTLPTTTAPLTGTPTIRNGEYIAFNLSEELTGSMAIGIDDSTGNFLLWSVTDGAGGLGFATQSATPTNTSLQFFEIGSQTSAATFNFVFL
jgi:hypothetical protein